MWTCPICGKEFKNQETCLNHIDKEHNFVRLS